MIENWQTVLAYPTTEAFESLICVYEETGLLSDSDKEWLEAWREFDECWTWTKNEDKSQIRIGHYMGWITRERTL